MLPAPIAADVGHWLRTRSEGGPRSRPRNEHTVRIYLNRVHPLLLDWSSRYVHLREVTASDVITATEPLPGNLRRADPHRSALPVLATARNSRHDLPLIPLAASATASGP